MKKNFQLGQSNEIIIHDEIFDLHNCYDLTSITIMGSECSLKIFLSPTHGTQNKIYPVFFFFNLLDYLKFSPGFGTRSISNIDEMGYKAKDDRDDEWLLTEQQATWDDHLFLRFSKNDFIRVHSVKATFQEVK